MNKRIEKLAEQAGKLAAEHYNDTADKFGIKPVFQDVFNEKFAELIIKKFVAITNFYGDGHKKDKFGRKIFRYTVDIGKEINELFGTKQ